MDKAVDKKISRPSLTNTWNLYRLIVVLFFFLALLPVLYTVAVAVSRVPFLLTELDAADTALLLLRSIALASVVAFVATVMGAVLAFATYGRSMLKLILLLPLFLSPYIMAVAWRSAFVHAGVQVSPFLSVVWVLVTIYTPLAMLVIGSALDNVSRSFVEAGILITGKKYVLMRVVLPLLKPALFSAFVLVFIFSISGFAVPGFLGVRVLTTEIFTQFSAFYNFDLAIVEALLLIAVCVALLMTERRYLSGAPFFSVSSRGGKIGILSAGSTGTAFAWFWFALSVVLPLAALVLPSSSGSGYFEKAWLLLRPTVVLSLRLAFAGALLVVVLGFIFAYFQVVKKVKNSRITGFAMLFTFAIPSTVLGLSLIKFYNRPWLNIIYSGFGIIILGYVAKYLFISAKILENGLKQIKPSLGEAALLSGASEFKRIMKIYLPLLLPSLLTAFTVIFVFALGELGFTIMVYPPGSELMSIKVFTIMANAPQALTNAMILIVLGITLAALLVLFLSVRILRVKKESYG